MNRRTFIQTALATAAMPACAHPTTIPAGWTTAAGTEYVLPRWQWLPQNARDIVETVARARSEGRRVRMTGSKLSFSDVAIVDDWTLEPQGLARFLDLDTSRLRPGTDTHPLVRIASGLRIRELNKGLRDRGLALQNMGGWDGQTFVGAAMTGTHGSGLAFGPLASQIESIQVVTKGGELLQVEPSGGISDPAKFPSPLPEDATLPVTLRQEDVLFQALAVSMGCLGVVYSVTLRAVPAYWLVERRTFTTWEALTAADGAIARFLGGRPLHPPDRDPDHIEVYLVPYARPDGTHAALLTERWRTEQKPPRAGEMVRKGSAVEELGLLADEAGLLEPFLAAQSTDEVRKLQEDGLSGQATDYYADISPKVFSTGALNRLGVYGIEPAFALGQTMAAVTTFLRVAEQLAAEGMRHSAPISLRFGAASRAALSMHQGRQTMSLEMALLRATPHAEEMLRTYEDVFVNGSFAARPHWGLDRNVLRGREAVKRLYPDTWEAWRAAYEELNSHGVFDARFTDRLGISKRAG
jgi:FAD/FMN-containing dehydrogenase